MRSVLEVAFPRVSSALTVNTKEFEVRLETGTGNDTWSDAAGVPTAFGKPKFTPPLTAASMLDMADSSLTWTITSTRATER
jgi:hypothetical protein